VRCKVLDLLRRRLSAAFPRGRCSATGAASRHTGGPPRPTTRPPQRSRHSSPIRFSPRAMFPEFPPGASNTRTSTSRSPHPASAVRPSRVDMPAVRPDGNAELSVLCCVLTLQARRVVLTATGGWSSGRLTALGVKGLALWIARYETCYRGAIVRDEAAFCASCGEAIMRPTTGRLARFCSAACRNAAYRRRRQQLPENAARAEPGGRYSLGQRLQLRGRRDTIGQ